MTETYQGRDCGDASGDAMCTRPVGHPGAHYDATVGLTWTADDPPAGLLPRVDELTARRAAGTMMDAETQRRLTELESLAAPSEDGALNLGPIIERQRVDWSKASPSAAYVSAADVMPLVREVMRLRREAAFAKTTMPGDAVLRSALPGIARHVEDMRHVFAELLAATCTGCRTVDESGDMDVVDGCPVHGEVAELRRSLDWSAQQHDRIAAALGPEYLAPFGPDTATAAVERIERAAELESTMSAARETIASALPGTFGGDNVTPLPDMIHRAITELSS